MYNVILLTAHFALVENQKILTTTFLTVINMQSKEMSFLIPFLERKNTHVLLWGDSSLNDLKNKH